MKEGNYTIQYPRFTYLWRVGGLDPTYLNATVYKTEEGKWDYKHNPKVREMFEKYWEEPVACAYHDDESLAYILEKEKVKQWHLEFGLKYNKCLDK